MKKKILLCFCLVVSISAMAQHIQYGAAAGVTYYSMKGEATGYLNKALNFTNGIISTRPVTGFYSGGYVTIPVATNFSVEPGLYYSSKGYAITGKYALKGIDILSVNATASLRSSYIEIPVLLKVNFNGLQLFAGPQISYLTSARIKTAVGAAGINLLHTSMDITSQLNHWDAGVTGGIGYQFNNGVRITASYDRGLSKINNGQNIRVYNEGFKLGAGISF